MSTDPATPKKANKAFHLFPILIPNESKENFEKLFDSLVAEWKPAGTTALAEVHDLACLMWRRNNLDFFPILDRAREIFGSVFENKDQPGWDEDKALRRQTDLRSAEVKVMKRNAKSLAALHRRTEAANLQAKKVAETVLGIDFHAKQIEGQNFYLLAKHGDELTIESLENTLKLRAYIDSRIEQKVRFLISLKDYEKRAINSERQPSAGAGGTATLRQPRGKYRQSRRHEIARDPKANDSSKSH
jgi:hypothetical protein